MRALAVPLRANLKLNLFTGEKVLKTVDTRTVGAEFELLMQRLSPLVSRRKIMRYRLLDFSVFMRDARVCDETLKVAETQYLDLLPKVRSDVARVMSTQLVHYGYRSIVCWSEEDGCFIGCLINVGRDFVSFHGKTAVELQESFRKATYEYVISREKERRRRNAS